jgi:ABC-type Fe3+ transport system permease subunit/DNA-binding beta-propeller fold protein YncE
MNWGLLWNSLIVSGSATVLAVAFGFSAALWANALKPRSAKIVTIGAILALALPPFLVTNCWIELLGQTGVWRNWLPLDIYSLGGTIWILSLLLWPISFLFLSAALRRVEPAHVEADPMLSGFELVRWLILPLAKNALLQAAVVTFVLALNNFAVPAILQTKVFPAETWVSFNSKFDYAEALQLGWPMIVGPLLLLICFRASDVSFGWRTQGASGSTFRRALGQQLFWITAVASLFVIFFSLIIPIAQLGGSARTWRELWPAFAAGQLAVTYSLLFAGLTATAVIAVVLLAGIAAPNRSSALQSFLWLPFFIPGVLLGIAMIWIFNRPSLSAIYQSLLIVVIAYAIRYSGFGWSAVSHAMRNADRTLTDVTRIEGASRWQTLRHALWPQISNQAAAAWYITYLLCLWDVETLVLIVPPGEENLSLRIFNLLHYGHNAQVNALCLILLALAVLPLLLFSLTPNFSGGTALRNTFFKPFQRFFALATIAILSGCSVQQSDHVLIQSKLFDSVQVIGSRGTALGQLNKPRSVTCDRNDNLYVVDMTARVQKFSPDGKFLTSWQLTQTTKGKPKGMDHDKDGNIILVEPHYQRVNHFSTDGKLLAQWGEHGTNVGQLAFPRAVAVNSHGELYITEYSVVERVQHFSADGKKYLGSFGSDGQGPGQFSRAEGVGIDSQDRVYVADSCNHRIEIFSSDGKFLRTYGKAGSNLGEMSYPYDIRVDKQGYQFVCEFGNSRIQIFDANDKPVEALGKPGGAPGELSNPWSIALDSKGNLYVADSQNHRVQKFIRKTRLAAAQRRSLSLTPRFNERATTKSTAEKTISTVFPHSGKTVETVSLSSHLSTTLSLNRGVNQRPNPQFAICNPQ